MKLLRVLLACLLCSSGVLAQSKPVVENKGNLGLHVVQDHIQWYRHLESEDSLLLVGSQNLQVIDLPNTRVVETRPVTLPLRDSRGRYVANDDWELSPDGSRMLIVGHSDAMDGKRRLAWVWDLREGKRLAVLDKSPYDVRTGIWSKNGKTLVTSDHNIRSAGGYDVKHVFSFWDGETYEYRGAVSLDNVTWVRLSDDGRRFFAAVGKEKSWLGLEYTSDSAGVIGVWDTRTGQLEKSISVAGREFSPKTREIEVSPDGRFLVFVNKHKSNPAEHRLLAWELDGDVRLKFEARPRPKIDDSRVVFSPDGRYFAVDVGKNLQIYETDTGEKRYELADVELPYKWLNNEVILDVHPKRVYSEKSDPMQGVDVTTGSVLYKTKLTFKEEEHYTGVGCDKETFLIYTEVVPNPLGKMYAAYDEEYVRLYDTRTGALLQTVISPPPKLDMYGKVVYDKKGQPKLSRGAAVKSVAWSRDGRTLYVFSANGQSVSVWRVVGN